MLLKIKRILLRSVLVILSFEFLVTVFAYDKSSQYPTPLAQVTAYFDRTSGELEEVFVMYPHEKNEGWCISESDDRYVKETKFRSFEHIHKEPSHMARYLSAFEAEQINRIIETFITALQILDQNVEREYWDRCATVDKQLSRFLLNFYYLLSAAYQSFDLLPQITRIDDSLVNSEAQSQQRVQSWQTYLDRRIKLRISIKELIFRLKQWQKSELDNPQRDMLQNSVNDCIPSYELFIRCYFNL